MRLSLPTLLKIINTKLEKIVNLPFLVCLSLLLVNDFYLKVEYHNSITGKLSDFSGLYIFTIFWTSLFPKRKLIIATSIAILFILWKSEYSQPFINFFSEYLYSIDRVVDYTDLWALPVIPLAVFLFKKSINFHTIKPVFIGLLAFFSFCATSRPEPTQEFEQPQYLLFNSTDSVIIQNSKTSDHFNVCQKDKSIVVEVKKVFLSKYPILDDEYHKIKILKKLELYFLRDILVHGNSSSDLEDYINLKNELLVKGNTSFVFDCDEFGDSLNFQNSRLHGDFKRYSKEKKLLVLGKFRNGLEDSIWTIFNDKHEIEKLIYFENGEKVLVKLFENGRLISEKKFSLRAERIYQHKIGLLIIGGLILLLLFVIIRNHILVPKQKEICFANYSMNLWIFLGPFMIIWISYMLSSSFDSFYKLPAMGFVFKLIFAYLILFISFAVIFLVIKINRNIDLFFYILLLSLILVCVNEWMYMSIVLDV